MDLSPFLSSFFVSSSASRSIVLTLCIVLCETPANFAIFLSVQFSGHGKTSPLLWRGDPPLTPGSAVFRLSFALFAIWALLLYPHERQLTHDVYDQPKKDIEMANKPNPIRDELIVIWSIEGLSDAEIAERIKESIRTTRAILKRLRPRIEAVHKGIARQVAQGVYDNYMRKAGFPQKKRCFRPT